MATAITTLRMIPGIVPEAHHRSRGYQLEMLEESMKRNIIVAVRSLSSFLLICWDHIADDDRL